MALVAKAQTDNQHAIFLFKKMLTEKSSRQYLSIHQKKLPKRWSNGRWPSQQLAKDMNGRVSSMITKPDQESPMEEWGNHGDRARKTAQILEGTLLQLQQGRTYS